MMVVYADMYILIYKIYEILLTISWTSFNANFVNLPTHLSNFKWLKNVLNKKLF